MKKLYSILFIITLATQSDAQQGKSDRERDGLHGSVQSVRTELVVILEENGKQTIGARIPLHTVSYDPAGNRTEIVNFDESGEMKRKVVYTYEQEGLPQFVLFIRQGR